MPDLLHVASIPARGLTREKWQEVESYLEQWKKDVMRAVKQHPKGSYEAGYAQVMAFVDLLGRLGTASVETAGQGPTAKEATYWVEQHTFHEFDDALNAYVGKIKDSILYMLGRGENALTLASALYHLTQDSEVNWRTIARTEAVKAMAEGRLKACEDMGYDRVWCPPHAGACGTCRRLIENRDFPIQQVRGVTNYGLKMRDWRPCIPLHPHCRHAWLPYDPDVVEEARANYRALEDAGLTDDDTLDEMFDTSGQIKPQYASDPRLAAVKTRAEVDGLFYQVLAGALEVAKTRRAVRATRVRMLDPDALRTDLYQREPDPAKVEKFAELYRSGAHFEPPKVSHREDGTDWIVDGQHRVLGARAADHARIPCEVYRGLSWEDEQRMCREAMGEEVPRPEVAKGFFDSPQEGRDPAFFEGTELRPEVDTRLKRWAHEVLGRGYHRWAHLYLMGGATSRQWLSHPERDSDIDLQLVIDCPALRRQRRKWRGLSDHDLHYALVALVKAGLEGTEVVPGIALDAFVRPEQTVEQFEQDARASGQAVWDVLGGRWVCKGYLPDDGTEVYGDPWLEGVGGSLASDHPDWLSDARTLVELLDDMLREYTTDPSPDNRAGLEKAYGVLHTIRSLSYEGSGGEEGRGNFLWQYAVNFGPLMQVKHLLYESDLGKVWPGYSWVDVEKMGTRKMGGAAATPGTGVEHWITVHPHGPDEPGQPVLVRNNSDGTMTVIGGAGGSLNHLRLDKGRRIDDKKSKVRSDKSSMTTEEPLSEEEQRQQEEEFKQREGEARGVIEKAEQRKQALRGRLEEYIKGEVGYRLGEKHITHAGGDEEVAEASKTETRKQLQQLRAAALHTLAYGEISRKDANESPFLTEEKHGDFEGVDEKPKDDDTEVHEPADENGDTLEPPPEGEPTTAEEDIQRERSRMPKLPPLSKDQAQAIMELDREIARLGKQQSKARKVLREGGSHKESLALDWRDADVKEDVSRRVADEMRTQVARDLENTAESKRSNPNRTTHQRALVQGAYDSVDAFTHAVLGVSAIPPSVAKLLGPNGAAQLAAHAIRERLGETGLTMQQVLDKLDEHTRSQQLDVGNTALARARKAADTAVQMREERKLSETGQSRWLLSMTRSYEMEKMNEAARLLGMAIGGQEATSALKVALQRPEGDDKIKVGGFESAGQIKALAQKAGVKLEDGDISRVGSGNYSLAVEPERMSGLMKFDEPPNTELRKRLRKLRTPGQLQREVDDAKDTPGMTDQLDDAQARGKLVLTTTAGEGRGCVLAFAPGRGKTHTALAAALQRMADDGVPQGQGNTWVVCPTTAMAEWAGTIAKNSTRSVQMIGREFEHLGGGVIESRGRGGAHAQRQLSSPADFNIVSQEHLVSLLKKHPELADQIKAARVIGDETQKAKNEKTDRWQAMDQLAKHTTERWALSGTTVEKKIKDLGAQKRWADPEHSMTPTAMEEKFGKLGQEPHILGQDQVQQFREGLDEGMYQLGADEGTLPDRLPDQTHKVDLDPEHEQALQQTVKSINETRAEAKQRGLKGMSGVEAEGVMRKALYDRPGNAIVKDLADAIDSSQPFEYDGDENGENAGTYEPKHIVFSQFVKQLDHVVSELEGRGHKVFFAHGGMSNDENDKVLKAFLAHQGAATLVSSDKNSTARSLQFGKNKGQFQYGATQMHHYSLPDNNATIQQREARIRRKGSAKSVPIQYHRYSAGTPAEVRQEDRLARERRVQDLAGNSEQMVGGKDTLHHELERLRAKAAA